MTDIYRLTDGWVIENVSKKMPFLVHTHLDTKKKYFDAVNYIGDKDIFCEYCEQNPSEEVLTQAKLLGAYIFVCEEKLISDL